MQRPMDAQDLVVPAVVGDVRASEDHVGVYLYLLSLPMRLREEVEKVSLPEYSLGALAVSPPRWYNTARCGAKSSGDRRRRN